MTKKIQPAVKKPVVKKVKTYKQKIADLSAASTNLADCARNVEAAAEFVDDVSYNIEDYLKTQKRAKQDLDETQKSLAKAYERYQIARAAMEVT